MQRRSRSGRGQVDDEVRSSWAASRGRCSKSKYYLGWSACIQPALANGWRAGTVASEWALHAGLTICTLQQHACLEEGNYCGVEAVAWQGRAGQGKSE
jgi:hypothetical protein